MERLRFNAAKAAPIVLAMERQLPNVVAVDYVSRSWIEASYYQCRLNALMWEKGRLLGPLEGRRCREAGVIGFVAKPLPCPGRNRVSLLSCLYVSRQQHGFREWCACT